VSLAADRKKRGVTGLTRRGDRHSKWAGGLEGDYVEKYFVRVDRFSSEQLPKYAEATREETAGCEGRLADEAGLGCARGICVGAVLQIIALSAGAMCFGLYWILR
jgi:hypothetical protein